MANLTYRHSGVDIDRKEAMLRGIGPLVKRTFRPEVLHEHGSFGGLFAADFEGLKSPVLVASTDSVGTKVRLGLAAKRRSGLGADLLHHCINDILVQGADPLFFLDYFASSRLDPELFGDVLAGLTEACVATGTALLGGETAEMPGTYAEGEVDIVGAIIGVVERERLLPRGVEPGDVLLGLRSDGLHTNGYSLVNDLVARDRPNLHAPVPALGETLADALLRPHRCYLEPVRRLRREVEVRALAHVTGGGILENLRRVLPSGVGAVVDATAWSPNPIFQWIIDAAPLDGDEAYRVYNMGLGLVVCVQRGDSERALSVLRAAGEEAWVAGEVVADDQLELRR